MASRRASTVKPELAITPAQAQALIGRVAEGCTVTTVTELHGGEIGAVYQVDFADRTSPLVLKVYSEALHWKMRKEANVCRLLADRLGVPVPRILLADDSRSLIDLNFIVMSKLEGRLLGNIERTLTPPQLFAAYSQMGQLLREIHRIAMDSFGYIGPDGVWTAHAGNRVYVTFQFDRKLADFVKHGGDSTLCERAKAFIVAHTPLLDGCSTASLCHFDFHAGNILALPVNGAPRLSGLLDFEGAIAGDPLMDLAKAMYYFTAADAPKTEGLLDGYGAIDRPDWQSTLALYRLYCTLELWCWMAEIGNHAALPGLTAELQRSL